MFIFDGMTVVVFVCLFALVYGILEFSQGKNEEGKSKSVEYKIGVASVIAILCTVGYSYFMSQGSETLLSDSYVDAGANFNRLSGMESVKSIADI